MSDFDDEFRKQLEEIERTKRLMDIANPSATSSTADLVDQISRALGTYDGTHFSALDRASDILKTQIDRDNSLRHLLDQALGTNTVSALSFNLESVLASQAQKDEVMKAILGPHVDATNLARDEAFLKATEYNEIIARNVMGPLADLKASGILDQLASPTVNLNHLLGGYESRFKLAEASDLAALASEVTNAGSFASLYRDQVLQTAMATQLPWLETEDPIRSARAFAELQGIKHAVASLDSYGNSLLSGLRADIGDWRDKISFPSIALENLSVRSEYYIERGFRTGLTDFPAATFDKGLEIEELNADVSLVALYGEPVESSDDEDQSAFTRTNQAHLWLTRLETQIRKFIDVRMTGAYGTDWPRRQLPNGLYEKWVDKKTRAENAGRPTQPLICYADFTDYELVICKRDNWKLFQAAFRDQANVRESLQRLYLPRIETMHARPLMQDDVLLLYAELKRLSRAIAI
jgi:hypothetical protein